MSSTPSPPFVLLEDSKSNNRPDAGLLFEAPVEVLECTRLERVGETLAEIERLQRKGFYLAGWISYECAFPFHPTLRKTSTPLSEEPLIWLGVFKTPRCFNSAELNDFFSRAEKLIDNCGFSENPIANETAEDFAAAFDKIMDYITAGDIYQVNHTFRLELEGFGPLEALYARLRKAQPVPFSSLIDTGGWRVLSLSPELFICRQGNHLISRPMKGTARPGKTLEQMLRRMKALELDEKNRAENLMITDLIRNDFSRVCQPGSVRVGKLFDVERFSKVLQMSSEVRGTLRPEISFGEIFQGLFPCGSITGAPKIRAMEIIYETEKSPRGLYTGALGYLAPEGDFNFSVPIRTVVLNKAGYGHLGIGSGIVAGSTKRDEYEECFLKSRFLHDRPPDFALIETILWTHGQGFTYLERHLERLRRSALFFEFPLSVKAVKKSLQDMEHTLDQTSPHKIRLTVDNKGRVCMESTPIDLNANKETCFITLARKKINKTNHFLFHKTTYRAFYDEALRKARLQSPVYDVIFQNQEGEITEGTFNTIFIEKNHSSLLTPHLNSGLLPGVLRSKLLESGKASETSLTFDDLVNADNIYLGNSVRGLFKVKLC